jgi:hypothetical protein
VSAGLHGISRASVFRQKVAVLTLKAKHIIV